MYTRQALIERFERGEPPELLFFWGHTPARGQPVGRWVLSQWFPSPFVVDGLTYPTAEHWMMAEKARLFGDDDMLARILSSATPADAKRLGRSVRGFDEARWTAERVDIVRRGNLARFEQNPSFREFLAATSGKVLVEAAPRDTIWGIGLGAENPRAQHPSTWRGQNLLGFALGWVRDQLAR